MLYAGNLILTQAQKVEDYFKMLILHNYNYYN